MCGRYLVDDEVYADMWMLMNNPDAFPGVAPGASDAAAGAGPDPVRGIGQNLAKGEVFPTNIAPVIAIDDASANIKVQGRRWGFPHWKGSGVIINARAETALAKKMFSKPLLNQRCVIPSSGFFEWNRTGSGKKADKYLLRMPGEHILFMAGMIGVFPDANGDIYEAFVILTTAANPSVAPIHDRMPVILASDEKIGWIRDDEFMEYVLHRPGPGLVAAVDPHQHFHQR